jgi:hypothetical protein
MFHFHLTKSAVFTLGLQKGLILLLLRRTRGTSLTGFISMWQRVSWAPSLYANVSVSMSSW